MVEEMFNELGIHFCGEINTDVLVVGGGPAGIGAAVGAAKSGSNTMLVEKSGFLGGMATLAAVSTICGAYSADKKEKIIGGAYTEWLEELRKLGGLEEGVDFGQHRADICDHHLLKTAADRLLLNHEVDLLFHSQLIGVKKTERRLDYVLLANKEGVFKVHASQFIDATGDADIATRCGAPYEIGDNEGNVQAATSVFKMGDVDLEQSKQVTKDEFNSIIRKSIEDNEFELHRPSGVFMPSARGNSVICNMNWIKDFNALNSREMTKAEIQGREASIEYSRFMKKKIAGFEKAHLSEIATQIGIRETRRIVSNYTLTEKDVLEGATFEDGITWGAWPVEYHNPLHKKPMKTYLKQNYQIPFSTMLPQGVDNLIIAGRPISTTHFANASTRVMAPCLATGQASGAAAVLNIEQHISSNNISVHQLKERLIAQGSII